MDDNEIYAMFDQVREEINGRAAASYSQVAELAVWAQDIESRLTEVETAHAAEDAEANNTEPDDHSE